MSDGALALYECCGHCSDRHREHEHRNPCNFPPACVGKRRLSDEATPPLVAAPPVPPVVPDSEERWADLNLSDDERAGLLSALDPGRCVCRHLELTCTGPDGHPNRHAAWNGRGNLIAWACYCHSSKSPHMDPEAGIANV